MIVIVNSAAPKAFVRIRLLIQGTALTVTTASPNFATTEPKVTMSTTLTATLTHTTQLTEGVTGGVQFSLIVAVLAVVAGIAVLYAVFKRRTGS